MSAITLSGVAHWAGRVARASLVAALLIPLAALLTDLGWGHEVLLIVPHDLAVVRLNRSLWSAGEPVAEIYGNPMTMPARVLLASHRTILHPEESPALSLVPVASGGMRPIQVRTLWWGARLATTALAVAAAVLFGASSLARRRSSAPNGAGAARSGRRPAAALQRTR